MTEYSLFTSESVSEGHPDKIADQISDAVLDAIIAEDPRARVACETLVTTNRIVLAGEVRAGSKDQLKTLIKELEPKVRDAIKDIGYEQHLYDSEESEKLAASRWSNVMDFIDWIAKRCGGEITP